MRLSRRVECWIFPIVIVDSIIWEIGKSVSHVNDTGGRFLLSHRKPRLIDRLIYFSSSTAPIWWVSPRRHHRRHADVHHSPTRGCAARESVHANARGRGDAGADARARADPARARGGGRAETYQ